MSFRTIIARGAEEAGVTRSVAVLILVFLVAFCLALLFTPLFFAWSLLHPKRHYLLLIFSAFAVLPAALSYYLSKSRILKGRTWSTKTRAGSTVSIWTVIFLIGFIPVFVWAASWIALCFQLSGEDPKDGWQEYVKKHTAFTMLCGLGPQVVLTFWLSWQGHTVISLSLAMILAKISFSSSYSGLQVTKGIIRFLGDGKATNSPASMLANAAIFTASFACIHLNIARLFPTAYVGLHGWQDALYFSVVTLATVGYGDVYPISHLARWASAMEICAGFVMLVIAVNTSLSAWLQTHQREEDALESAKGDSGTIVSGSQKDSGTPKTPPQIEDSPDVGLSSAV